MTKFINPGTLVRHLGLQAGDQVVDFGCGSGFYVLPAAQLVGTNGAVCAIDIIESKLAATQSIAKQMGFYNVSVMREDLEKPVSQLAEGSFNAVIVANILHEAGNTAAVIANAYRVLKTGGRILVVEWKKEPTPLGPPYEKRVSERDMEAFFQKAGFRLQEDLDHAVDTYHYAKIFVK